MTAKYEISRARMHVRKVGTSALRDVNVIDSASYSFDEQTIEKQSTNEVKGVVASKTISTTGTLTVVFGSTEYENFVMAVRAKTSTQAANGTGTFTFPVAQAGECFKLPDGNILTTTVAGKVEGVDYQVFKASGIVSVLTDNAAAIEGCGYTSGVAKRAAIGAGADAEYEVFFTDELNGEMTQFYKWKPNLPQNIQLVNISEFSTYEVSGQILLDESKPASGDMGQFGQKLESQVAA